MEEIMLGKIPNDVKTCSWPQPGREAQTIKIWNRMQEPIPDDLLEKIRTAEITKCKSNALYEWALEIGLTLDFIDKDLNVIMIAHDPKTNESTQILHCCESEDPYTRVDKLIRTLDKECVGSREENGQKCASELFTIIANVVAAYCANDEQYEKSFKDVVEFWRNKLSTKVEKTN